MLYDQLYDLPTKDMIFKTRVSGINLENWVTLCGGSIDHKVETVPD